MINDYALYGKKHLVQNKDSLSAFTQSVELRISEAIKRMNLPSNRIVTTCICSMEKESFMIQENGNMLLYMDKHQMDSLVMLTWLYCIYGQIDIKYGLFMLMYEKFPYFEKRLSFSLLVLQAEKCFNRGDLDQAEAYMNAADSQEYAFEFIKLREEKTADFWFVDNLLHKKSLCVDNLHAFSLNFFVFHECAHAKYALAKEDLMYVIDAVEAVLLSTEGVQDHLFEAFSMVKPEIPLEEYVCDAYALYLLFDFVFQQTMEYESEQMIDSYFISVLNLALIHSKKSDIELLPDDAYIYASFRAICSIKALLLLWKKENRPPSVVQSIEKAMNYSYQRYRNLKLTMDSKWGQLFAQYHKPNKDTLTYNEEKTLATQLTIRFSQII